MSTNHEQSYIAHPVSLAAAAAFCALTGCDKVWGSFIDELPPTPPVSCSPTADPSPCPSGTTCSAETATCVPTGGDMAMTPGDDMAMTPGDMAIPPDMQTPLGMIYVVGMPFEMGKRCGSGSSTNNCYYKMIPSLPNYFLDATEVTWKQVQDVVTAKPSCLTQAMNPWQRPGCPASYMNSATTNPATCIAQAEAECICNYLGKRLPREEELEFAAVGTTGAKFAWGNTPDPANTTAACFNQAALPCAVNAKYQTKFGAQDGNGFYNLAGNVREWTSSYFCVYNNTSGSCTVPVANDKRYAQRGGSYDVSDPGAMEATQRIGDASAPYFNNLGFRCAQNAQ